MKTKKEIFKLKEKKILIEALIDYKKEWKKKTIKNFIKHKSILINDKIITNPNTQAYKNDVITILYNKNEIKPDFKIIYEDQDLIAIDKKEGLLSISTEKEKFNTAYRMVSDYLKKINPKAKIFIIHRLDKDTSGVLLFAKNKYIQELFQKNWNQIVLKREYIAIVLGKVTENKTIETYLKEDKFKNVYSDKNGKKAITEFKVLKTNNNISLLQINIKTGRKNQIRVHLSEINHPIVGDKKYGKKSHLTDRLYLHANKLELIDPRNNKILKIKAEIPQNFKKLM